MAAQKGDSLLLKLGDAGSPETFTAVAGLRTKSITLGDEQVDVTNADTTSKWRQLLEGAGVSSMSASGDGIFDSGNSADAVLAVKIAKTHRNWQIVVPGLGTFEGAFQISSLGYAGDHNAELTTTMSLESAGDIAYTAD